MNEENEGKFGFDGNSAPVPTRGFDYGQVDSDLMGLAGKTLDEMLDSLRARGCAETEIAELRRRCAPHGRRMTLPEALDYAQRKVAGYLPKYANMPAWGALASGRFHLTKKPRLTEGELEQLEKMEPMERIAALLAPGKSPAEANTDHIRLNPRALLEPGTPLVPMLVELLEAAHFGTRGDCFPGLLQGGNRKAAASAARKALRLLSGGERGNPPSYAPEFLAMVVGVIEYAWSPIKEEWASSGSLEEVRKSFGEELEGFSNKELKSLLTDKPLEAAGRMAERATGIQAESFVTAFKHARAEAQAP